VVYSRAVERRSECWLRMAVLAVVVVLAWLPCVAVDRLRPLLVAADTRQIGQMVVVVDCWQRDCRLGRHTASEFGM